jgi:hypothetical protein
MLIKPLTLETVLVSQVIVGHNRIVAIFFYPEYCHELHLDFREFVFMFFFLLAFMRNCVWGRFAESPAHI